MSIETPPAWVALHMDGPARGQLDFIRMRSENAVDRNALLDEIRLNPKLVGEFRSKLLLTSRNGRPRDLVLDGGTKAQIESYIFGPLL